MTAAVVLPYQRERINKNGVLCRQCYTRQPREHFRTNLKTGEPHIHCGGVPGYGGCKEKYRAWYKLTDAEKLDRVRPFESDDAYSVALSLSSKNRKLGDIPATRTARGSCPDSCSFKNAGCFGEFGLLRMHWERVSERGLSWREFCRSVTRFPKGQVWRHNEVGDLPGRGDAIDPVALSELVIANKGRRGFTFTHKSVLESKPLPERTRYIPSAQERALWLVSNRRAIARVVRAGFTINLSADSIAQADELAALGIAPVSVVLPHDAPSHATKTPAGHQVVVCPNETHGLTCSECQLCATPTRKSIIGFRAHGQSKAIVSEIVRARRPNETATAKVAVGRATPTSAVAYRVAAGDLPRLPAPPDDSRRRPALATRPRRRAAGRVPSVPEREERSGRIAAAARDRVAALLTEGRAAAAQKGRAS